MLHEAAAASCCSQAGAREAARWSGWGRESEAATSSCWYKESPEEMKTMPAMDKVRRKRREVRETVN